MSRLPNHASGSTWPPLVAVVTALVRPIHTIRNAPLPMAWLAHAAGAVLTAMVVLFLVA